MDNKITMVWCTLEFVGFHRWKDAKEPVAYLSNNHRHKFFVKAAKRVTHNNRQIEFITLKNQIQEYIRTKYEDQIFDASCEMIADDIAIKFELNEVTVSEDNENGATVYVI